MLAKKKSININVLQQTYDIDHEDDFFEQEIKIKKDLIESLRNQHKPIHIFTNNKLLNLYRKANRYEDAEVLFENIHKHEQDIVTKTTMIKSFLIKKIQTR